MRLIKIQIFAIAALLFALGMPMAGAQAKPVSQTTTNAQAQTQAPKFDGKQLYDAAFKALVDNDIALIDPAVRAQWVKEWQHKHDSDGVLNTEEGTDQAVMEMMQSLHHRFNYYLTPDETASERQQEDPTLVGIGASLAIQGAEKAAEPIVKALPKNATRSEKIKAYEAAQKAIKAVTASDTNPLVIIKPMEDSPAIKAGVKANDRIVAVDGKSVNGETIDQIISTVKGKENTDVTLTIERKDAAGKATTLQITITRAKVIQHVVHTADLGNGIAYIKLDDFMSQYAVDEMADALHNASTGKAVVLDLRGNPGGSLSEVEAIAQLFLNHGDIIEQHSRQGDELITTRLSVEPEFALMTQSSSQDPTKISIKTGERLPELLPDSMPVVVLVDGNSYSAAEILSGTLQANHRAVVVGEPTGGKGVGQYVIQLPFDRDMHVTNFEFLPGDKAMNWIGVVPDIIVPQAQNFKADDQLVNPNDAQLKAAASEAQSLVGNQTALDAQRQSLNQKHHDDFNKKSQGN